MLLCAESTFGSFVTAFAAVEAKVVVEAILADIGFEVSVNEFAAEI